MTKTYITALHTINSSNIKIYSNAIYFIILVHPSPILSN